MGGITLEDFSQSVAYREIFGRGREEGRQQGEQERALRQLRLRCGGLSAAQEAGVCSLPLERLEQLAEALLEFNNASDLENWLRGAGG